MYVLGVAETGMIILLYALYKTLLVSLIIVSIINRGHYCHTKSHTHLIIVFDTF